MSKPTIQKYLDQYKYKKEELSGPKTILLVDITYFGRKYGIMVFRSYELKKNLYWKEVKRETKQAYIDGIRYLESIGWEISAVVCDGKRGLLGDLGALPIQMCHFHQSKNIKKYLTQNPRLEASKEFKEVSSGL